MANFEGYERREAKILGVLKEYGISSIDECKKICDEKGIDPYTIVQETQPICFENAKWAYTVGAAIAIKSGCKKAADAAAMIQLLRLIAGETEFLLRYPEECGWTEAQLEQYALARSALAQSDALILIDSPRPPEKTLNARALRKEVEEIQEML